MMGYMQNLMVEWRIPGTLSGNRMKTRFMAGEEVDDIFFAGLNKIRLKRDTYGGVTWDLEEPKVGRPMVGYWKDEIAGCLVYFFNGIGIHPT